MSGVVPTAEISPALTAIASARGLILFIVRMSALKIMWSGEDWAATFGN
jgi:hypothetical protein